ncbi:MAG: hypothetical protein JWR37_960 [Mycobacterium sp.]|nr:hypothetical protein [Mycobacterium sp.]
MMIVVGEIESPTADGRIVVAALADSLRLSVSGRQDDSLALLLGLGVKLPIVVDAWWRSAWAVADAEAASRLPGIALSICLASG